MSLQVGQTVVHPYHGAAVVDEFEEREVKGETERFVVLTAPDNDLTLLVPVDTIDDVIRSVIDATEVDDVLDVLREEPGPQKGHWSRRLKRNQKRLRSGDPKKVAMLLRDLTAKDQVKTLSPAEKRLYNSARLMLRGELAAALDLELDGAEELMDEALSVHQIEDDES